MNMNSQSVKQQNSEQKPRVTSQIETLLNENDKLIKVIEEKNEEIRTLTNNGITNQSINDSNKDKEIQNIL